MLGKGSNWQHSAEATAAGPRVWLEVSGTGKPAAGTDVRQMATHSHLQITKALWKKRWKSSVGGLIWIQLQRWCLIVCVDGSWNKFFTVLASNPKKLPCTLNYGALSGWNFMMPNFIIVPSNPRHDIIDARYISYIHFIFFKMLVLKIWNKIAE